MDKSTVLLDSDGPIATITINRPKTLNALDIPTLERLEERFAAAEADDAARVIVITGAGEKAFVAGGDIADLNSRQALTHYREFAQVIHRVFRRIEACEKPTIAAINGWALGGGTELLLATDLRIMAESARLGLPEIKLGIIPGAGGTQRLIRQVPLCRAKEMMFTGDHIDASTALSIGLVNRVVAKEDLKMETRALAESIAAKSPLILKILKDALLHGGDMTLAASLAYEQAMASLVFDAEDAHEGCSAFLEKRDARFEGK